MLSCPACGRPTGDTGASFCAACGAPLGPPVTIPVDEPETSPRAAPGAPPAPPAAKESQEDAARLEADAQRAALLAVASAVVALVGAFQMWVRIRIAGFSPPGSAQTGWQGGDGRTIAVAALASMVAAAAVAIGRRETWPKIVLLIAGATTAIIAVVNMVDAGSKAHDIQVQFGIPAEDVHAQLGVGLFLVAIGGLGLIAAGLRVRTSPA